MESQHKKIKILVTSNPMICDIHFFNNYYYCFSAAPERWPLPYCSVLKGTHCRVAKTTMVPMPAQQVPLNALMENGT